jgi:polyphosphate kinase
VPALIEAARAGKEVCVIVELRARFDEQENLNLAQRLQEAGVLVVYGVVGYKTHAKMTLVVRREGEHLSRYAHLGTGNYHAGNACLYTDYSLLTADTEICDDVHKVFMQLTGMGKTLRLKKLLQAPFSLYKMLLDLIHQETEHARAGRPARIIARMNALTDPLVISALYQASRHGVEIDLIIRGICCLRPGVPELSERIRVRSIIGRFLEHSRVYYFLNDGHEKLYLSSADWMERNLHKRIEVAFPIENKALMQRIKRDGLERYLEDNGQSWQMLADGRYQLNRPEQAEPRLVQMELLNKMAQL